MIGNFLIFLISWFCIVFAVAVTIIIDVIAVIAVIIAVADNADVVIVSFIFGWKILLDNFPFQNWMMNYTFHLLLLLLLL